MADNHWSEIFNLNEELKRIEDEVDKRLEETLAEDPHVIEAETVHYDPNPGDVEDPFRMRQSLPTFGPLGSVTPQGGPIPAGLPQGSETAPASAEEMQPQPASGSTWMDGPVEDYVAPRAVEPAEAAAGTASTEPQVPVETAEAAGDGTAAAGETAEAAGNGTAAAGEAAEAAGNGAIAAEETVESHVSAIEETAPQAETSTEAPAGAGPAGPAAGQQGTAESSKTAAQRGTTEPARTEAQRSATEPARTAAQRRRILLILLIMIVVLAAILGQWYYKEQVIPGRQYKAAEESMAAGDYDAALATFEGIRGYKDAAERITQIEYDKASAYVEAGSLQDAVDYIDNLSEPTDEMQTLRASAIYRIAEQYYADGNLEAAEGELLLIKDYAEGDASAIDLLHEIQYQEASDAFAIYDFDTAEPILAALGDYEDAAVLLAQVENAIDIVYTDVARNDNGKEIKGKTQYLWIHSVITPGAINGDASEEQTAAFRELAGATDSVDDEAVHVLMMHMDTTDAEMTYTDAEPIETDKSTVITKEITSYAAIDDTFGSSQVVYDPQTLQRSNTDYALDFEGSEDYAAKDADDKEVRMECKMADDGYWAKTRRVYAQMENGQLVGVPKHQLRTWTQVLNEDLADEVRAGFLGGNGQGNQ